MRAAMRGQVASVERAMPRCALERAWHAAGVDQRVILAVAAHSRTASYASERGAGFSERWTTRRLSRVGSVVASARALGRAAVKSRSVRQRKTWRAHAWTRTSIPRGGDLRELAGRSATIYRRGHVTDRRTEASVAARASPVALDYWAETNVPDVASRMGLGARRRVAESHSAGAARGPHAAAADG